MKLKKSKAPSQADCQKTIDQSNENTNISFSEDNSDNSKTCYDEDVDPSAPDSDYKVNDNSSSVYSGNSEDIKATYYHTNTADC